MYALVIDGEVSKVGRLPRSARRLDTGEWVMGLIDAPPELVIETGWVPVTEDRPELTEGFTFGDPLFKVVDGEVIATYPMKPETVETTRSRDREQHLNGLRAKARQVFAGNAPFTATERDRAIAVLLLDRLGD